VRITGEKPQFRPISVAKMVTISLGYGKYKLLKIVKITGSFSGMNREFKSG
jgi:hypothetical protein